MVNIPNGEWLCSACSGRSNVQLSFREYSEKMSIKYQDILIYLGLPFKNRPDEFFKVHSEAVSLFSLNTQAAVKQRAISQQIGAKNVVFDVGNIKFIRSPEKNDWRLPSPLLSKECYVSWVIQYYQCIICPWDSLTCPCFIPIQLLPVILSIEHGCSNELLWNGIAFG